MLQRQITEKLQATIAEVPAVALLGARQVGKTTLAKTIAKDIDSIYLDNGFDASVFGKPGWSD